MRKHNLVLENRLTNMVGAVGAPRFGYGDFGALFREDIPWEDNTLLLQSKMSEVPPERGDPSSLHRGEGQFAGQFGQSARVPGRTSLGGSEIRA
jgi:hypothetical protein